MIETVPSGPVALSQVWIGDKIIARDVHGDDLVDVLQQNGKASAWAVAPRSDTTELHRLTRMLGVDEVALTELLVPGHRVRFAELGDARLLRLRTPGPGGEVEQQYDLALIITDQVLLILADDGPGRQLATLLSRAADRLARGSADRAAQVVVESVIAGLAEACGRLEDAADGLAEDLFTGSPLSADGKLEAFRVRRRVTELRRVTDPTEDAISGLVQSLADERVGDDPDDRHWMRIGDHAARVAASVLLIAESLTAIFDTSLALDSARTNEVMKKLAGWAAIIAVPSLITGFVSMDLAFWGAGGSVAFYVYLVLMVLSAIGLFMLFRRKSWI